jgi:hypothetical protein
MYLPKLLPVLFLKVLHTVYLSQDMQSRADPTGFGSEKSSESPHFPFY